MRRDRGAAPPTFAATLAVVTALAALTPAATRAQVVSVGAVQQSFTFDDPGEVGLDRFRLRTLPWSVALPIGSPVIVQVAGAWAEGTATGTTGAEVSLSGVTDTDLSIGWSVGEWMVLSLDATVATGKSTLTTQEGIVAGVLAAELLPFPIATFGSGRQVGASVALATTAGGWGLGFAGGYRASSAFEPIPTEPVSYDPGNQIHARVALDRDIGGSSTFSTVVAFQRFTDDRLLDTNLFRAGSRLQAYTSIAFPLSVRASALVFAGVSHRSAGALLVDEGVITGASDTPAQQLFTGGGSARFPLGRSVALLPTAEMRVFRASDGASQGWVGTFGTSGEIRLGGNASGVRTILVPNVAWRTGSVVIDADSDVGLSGWEAGVTLRVGASR